MECRFIDAGERVQCDRCGRKLRKRDGVPLDRYHAGCYAWPRPHELGHWLALVFAAAGLSKRRYAWLRMKLGLTKSCGCGQREEALNTLGRWLRRWI